nr:MAG TPA: hypothetical protein [Caudoviricetes sp.]
MDFRIDNESLYFLEYVRKAMHQLNTFKTVSFDAVFLMP